MLYVNKKTEVGNYNRNFYHFWQNNPDTQWFVENNQAINWQWK